MSDNFDRNKLKIGFAGCGNIAVNYHMPALKRLNSVEISAFYDPQPGKAAEACRLYGEETAKVCSSYNELINDPSINVIYICVPNKWHSSLVIEALNANKHVMCEKPMAIASKEARDMLEASQRSGAKLTIGYHNRFRRDARYLKKICEEGRLGDIYFAKAHAVRRRKVPTWGTFLNKEIQGGGPLIDIGSHALDLALWTMNNYKPKYVVGNIHHGLAKQGSPANVYGPWEPKAFQVEDSAFALIVMQNGATVFLESSYALNTLDEKEAKVTLCGIDAGADMENGLRINGEKNSELYSMIVETDYDKKKKMEFGITEDPYELQSKLWIEHILYGGDLVVKPEQTLVVTEIIEAIYRSAESGGPVYF